MSRPLSYLQAMLLIICMVFTSGVSAYLHVGEHLHGQETGLAHHHSAEAHEQHQQDVDHEHHFHLHMVGDLHSQPVISHTARKLTALPPTQPLFPSLAAAPPIPPPNA
ncbi:hypothetical protein Q7C_2561 [Methylophaga frappieri]|uniref:Uncharacterized protein n=1 Tax=Methylophaga frappieri (strain ATCC BAA-2434 / DSM 25690 / JAM7) TaxID=754477 RepID=I1YL89_METFJ|nr:hypothetical protein [Methylophaga frappieri]AFJ03682.1 hypothetical protein Q7C_2561 [Methylophaga frappieri]